MAKNKNVDARVLNFDHITFWVANSKTASSFYVTRFGFKPLAVREPTKDNLVLSYAVKLNKITIIFESPTTANDEINKDLTAHGDFVKDIAFEVEDLDGLLIKAKEGGAEVVKAITEEKDEKGVVRYVVLKTYGDNTHTLVDRSKYQGILLPGYTPLDDDPVNEFL